MYFDEVAAKWDTRRRIERAKILANSIAEKINKKNNIRGLEVGCGTGLISFELRDVISKIYCTDTSDEMLSILKNKIDESRITNIYPYRSDLIYTDNFYQQFDVVFSSMFFHHIVDIKDELEKLHDILNNQGYLIIIDLDEEDGSFHKNEKDFCGHNGFKRSYLKEMLEESNFKDITFETVYNGEKQMDDKKIEYSLFLCLAKV